MGETTEANIPSRAAVSVRLGSIAAPVAFVAALGLAIALVALQPVGSPWWITADADATYAASGLNILLGKHTLYVDHPGLPEQEALAAGFGAQYLAEKATGSRSTGPTAFASDTLLHLDRARPVYRSLAIAFYLLGVALAFVLLTRLLGHWTWGLAGSVLWLGAPGLLAIAIQIRPDALLCALVLLAGYLVVRAAERRDAWLFALGAAAIGFATMVKLHAVGLVPALLVAAVWRRPAEGWSTRLAISARASVRGKRVWLVPVAAGLLALAIVAALNRPPFVVTSDQRTIVFTILATVGGYAICAWIARRFALTGADRLFDPFFAVLAVALLVGLALPMVFDLEDSLHMLASIRDTLTGHGVNEGINRFPSTFQIFRSFPLVQGLMVFAAAVAGALVGIWRRAPAPVIFAVAAATLAVMAFARYLQFYYYAPAYVASIPAALWLFRGKARRAAPLFLWPLIAIVVLPQLQHVRDTAHSAARAEQLAASVETVTAPLRRPGVVVVTPIPVPDTSYVMVEFYADYRPDYPYRFVSEWPPFVHLVEGRGLHVRYYAGPAALQVKGITEVDLDGMGTFRVRRMARFDDPGGRFGVLEILRAPSGF